MSTFQNASEPNVGSSFERLSKTANSLNSASDRLNDALEKLNIALKSLNLGISSWTTFAAWEDGPLSEDQDIGYDKINGKWGIALRKVFEDLNRADDHVDITAWHFSEAPREMRLQAIGHLNKLIEQLNVDAAAATERVAHKTAEAEAFAAAISDIAGSAPVKAGFRVKGSKS
jgi:hypothetical protein